jgi:hypothetical protein
MMRLWFGGLMLCTNIYLNFNKKLRRFYNMNEDIYDNVNTCEIKLVFLNVMSKKTHLIIIQPKITYDLL